MEMVTMSLPRFRLRTLTIAVAMIAMALGAGTRLLWRKHPDVNLRKIVIVNQSGAPIPRLELTVLGETVTLRSIPAGATVAASYPSFFGRFGRYDQFVVAGSLASGMELNAGFGFRVMRSNTYPVVRISPSYQFVVSEGGGAP
jgi:hypothetical protein